MRGGEQSGEGFGDRQAVHGYLLGHPCEAFSSACRGMPEAVEVTRVWGWELGSWGLASFLLSEPQLPQPEIELSVDLAHSCLGVFWPQVLDWGRPWGR